MTHPSHHARATPDKPAVVMADSGETLTYRALDAASNQGAHLFRRLGLVRGDRVALLIDNRPELFSLCFAAQRAGLIFTTLSTRLSVSEAAYIVADCGAKVLVVSDTLAGLARDLLDAVSPGIRRYAIGNGVPGYASWVSETAPLPTAPVADQCAGRDMLYSSGTTGRPKGVRTELLDEAFDAPNRLTNTMQALFAFTPETRYLSPAPLYHAAPLRYTMNTLRLGGTVYVMRHFDPIDALAAIARHRITHAQWVPSMFVRMLKLDETERRRHDVASLKVAIHAAAPCPIPVKERMIAWWGPILYEYYAGTEGNGFVVCDSVEWLAHKGTVGRPLNCEVKIVGESGDVLPPGAENAGTIYFAGGAAFEYHNDPEKTRESRHPSGWSTLGDVGYLDADGYLYLTDRKAHMIISGGVNIYPQEVENLLVTHPKVADVAVIGVPNEDFGEEVKAVVQPAPGIEAGPALADELIAFCRAHISHVKCPKSIDFEVELPRHPTGKLYKRLIRDRYWQGRASKLV